MINLIFCQHLKLLQILFILLIIHFIIKISSIISLLFQKNPHERLGCTQQSGCTDLQNHPFYKGLDWALLFAGQVEPPYKPVNMGDEDVEYFDPHFTKEPVLLTPDDQ